MGRTYTQEKHLHKHPKGLIYHSQSPIAHHQHRNRSTDTIATPVACALRKSRNHKVAPTLTSFPLEAVALGCTADIAGEKNFRFGSLLKKEETRRKNFSVKKNFPFCRCARRSRGDYIALVS